jgi:hypothetical protein
VIASRLDPKAGRVLDWSDRLHQMATDGRLITFLARGLSEDETNVAAYSFVKELMASSGKYTALIIALRGGEEFGPAFARVYGGSPQTLAIAWAKTLK